jgi:hypothetical protein
LQIESLLDEMQTLQRVSGEKCVLDGGETLLHGVRGSLAATARAVCLERLEIATNSPALVAPFSECGFVLVTHRGALVC